MYQEAVEVASDGEDSYYDEEEEEEPEDEVKDPFEALGMNLDEVPLETNDGARADPG